MKNALLLLFLASAILRAEPLADTIAALNLPGHGRYGQCVPFADALSDWLRAQGQSSRVIYYSYKPGLLRRTITHAIVAWERDGRWWAMGNETAAPRSLGRAEIDQAIDLAQRYDSRAYIASTKDTTDGAPLLVARETTSEAMATSLATLTPKAPPRVLNRRFYTDENGTQILAHP